MWHRVAKFGYETECVSRQMRLHVQRYEEEIYFNCTADNEI